MSQQIATHQPCHDCGSSDALTEYDWGTKCYSCGKTHNHVVSPKPTRTLSEPLKHKLTMHTLTMTPATDLEYRSVSSRGITRDTCLTYGVGISKDNYLFPYYGTGTEVVAYKKRGVEDKRFSVEGSWKDANLFGYQLFNKGGKYVTIVEGEFDALAAYQMLGSRYPVVSVRNGAGSALQDCKTHYEWLDSFENIVVCFDGDEPGTTAAAQVAELFGTKTRVYKHTSGFKDACDYLSQQEGKQFVERWWQSEQFVPDGIVAGKGLWDLVNQPIEKAECLYPYSGMNELTFGIRTGELITVTAGSGLGKSQFLREIVYHVLNNTNDNIGLMFLEESIKKTAKSIMSLAVDKPLHLPDTEVSNDELRMAFDSTLGTDRIYLFDHFGSTAVDNIISRVRFMAKALSCKYIFLDHVSIVVSSQDNGDERKALDEIMTRLRMIVQETDIALFAVSHLKRPDTKGHEEGAATSLSQLRGSGSIGQLSDIVLGLERNGQAEDPIERHTTKVRVLKNRFSGLTGPASMLYYDRSTGRMTERTEEAL
jgi:twinkle protein